MSRSLRRQIGHDAIADRDLAVGDLLEPGHHAQDRRLATPGRADEDHELAVADLQRDVVDRLHTARKDLADAVECDTSHALAPSQSLPRRADHIRAEAPAASASSACQSRSRSSAVSCVARRDGASRARGDRTRSARWSAPAPRPPPARRSCRRPARVCAAAGRMTRWNPGIELLIPGVSAHPGCIAWTTTPVPASSSAQRSASTTSARLLRA